MTAAPEPSAQTPHPPAGKLTAWLRLLRVPNLFTVPGDPLAGYALALLAVGGQWSWRAALPVAASLCVYCAGLLLNDVCDLKEDTRDRPNRPLPSGQVSVKTVFVASMVLLIAGAVLARLAGFWPGLVGVALILAIVFYDRYLKRLPVFGPLNMGLCRGLSLLLGAALLGKPAIQSPVVLLSAGGLTLYIAAVTAIAATETRQTAMRLRALLPTVVAAAWFLAVWKLTHEQAASQLLYLPLAAALFYVQHAILRLSGQPAPATVQATVGYLIRGLIIIQAGLIVLGSPPQAWIVAAAVAAMLPLAIIVGRKFYGS